MNQATMLVLAQLALETGHHLNNILLALTFRTDRLLRTAPTAELREQVQKIEESVRDGLDLARRLRALSQLSSADGPVRMDLNQAAEDALVLVSQERRDAIDVTVNFDRGAVPRVVANEPALREVLVSRLTEAINTLPAGISLTVRTRFSDGWVHCTVMASGDHTHGSHHTGTPNRDATPSFITDAAVIDYYGGELTWEQLPDGCPALSLRLRAAEMPAIEPLVC